MAIAEADWEGTPAPDSNPPLLQHRHEPRDFQRLFQLLLATVWLLDAVLQLQPFMFTRGANGFSGMLNGSAAGNPGWVAHTITWNGSIVYHHPVLTNAAFASIQFLIAFGIVYRRTTRYALGLSIVWSLGVWWFGEGAGGVFLGTATPFGGGPGGVLYYAVLAVLMWPGGSTDHPFVAARTIGVPAAKGIWIALWSALAALALVGAGRSPQALRGLVVELDNGEPGWLARIDRVSESFLFHDGTAAAILLAVVCIVAACGVLMPAPAAKATLVVALVVFAVIWVAVQDFGGILAPGATDPNSGLLVILLVLTYWPLTTHRTVATSPEPGPAHVEAS